MIVDRFIYSVKPGRTSDLVKLIKKDDERFPPPRAVRLYIWPLGHPSSQVVAEFEFENSAEQEKYWTSWLAAPETAAFFKEFYALLTDSGFTRERWTLAE